MGSMADNILEALRERSRYEYDLMRKLNVLHDRVLVDYFFSEFDYLRDAGLITRTNRGYRTTEELP